MVSGRGRGRIGFCSKKKIMFKNFKPTLLWNYQPNSNEVKKKSNVDKIFGEEKNRSYRIELFQKSVNTFYSITKMIVLFNNLEMAERRKYR